MEKNIISDNSFQSYLAAIAGSVQKHPQHMIVGDNVYTRILRVANWPTHPVSPGFLFKLYGAEFGAELPSNIVIELMYRYQKAILTWNWAMRWKENRLMQKTSSEQMPDPTEVKALEALESLKESSLYAGSDTIDVWLYIIIRSIGDVGTLDTVCRKITGDLKDMGMLVAPLIFEQPEAFRQTFILGEPSETFQKAYPGRIVQAEAVSALYPCLAGSINDGQGVYFGHSTSTGTGNLVNLKSGVENKNMVVVGASGEGKSVFLKSLINGLRLEGFRVFVFDMNFEYFQLCQETGGLYIDHTPGTGKYLDPLTIPAKCGIKKEDDARLIAVSECLHSTVSILADGCTPGERNAADRALMSLFQKVKIDLDRQETWDFEEQPFNFQDWYAVLLKDNDKDAKELAKKLAIYFTGSKKHLFKEAENLTIPDDCSLIAFQVGDAIEGADTAVGTAKMTMTLSFIQDFIRKEKRKGEKYTAIIFDEAQGLLMNPEASGFINRMATRIRHLNGLAVVGTNKPRVFFPRASDTGAEGGTGIWANSKYKIFFWLENSEITAIEQNAEIPREITEMLKGMHKTRDFLVRHLDRGWDRCHIYLPSSEMALFETRKEG